MHRVVDLWTTILRSTKEETGTTKRPEKLCPDVSPAMTEARQRQSPQHSRQYPRRKASQESTDSVHEENYAKGLSDTTAGKQRPAKTKDNSNGPPTSLLSEASK